MCTITVSFVERVPATMQYDAKKKKKTNKRNKKNNNVRSSCACPLTVLTEALPTAYDRAAADQQPSTLGQRAVV